jgi:hypothetical protein
MVGGCSADLLHYKQMRTKIELSSTKIEEREITDLFTTNAKGEFKCNLQRNSSIK